LPHRETDGYGLNMNTIDLLAQEGTNLIITCDCGVSNVKEVARANEKGMDVIITDHHSVPDLLPDAFAIIHPKVKEELYPDKTLAGAAVAFKLAQALLKHHKSLGHAALPNGELHEAAEKWLLDMVAIASVADMVPLLGESRTLTKYGLIVLNKTKRLGMQKLFLESRLMEEDGSKKREINAETISFQLAPRINAAGRMNHANVAYKLFVTNDPIAAIDLAFELNQNNKDRQKLTETIAKEATAQIDPAQKDAPFLFAFGHGWPIGLVGLIAGKLKEKYGKPAIIMAENNGEITGSGRSVEGFNMIETLQEMPEFFSKFGGHPMACGFSLASTELRESFQQKLTERFLEKTKDLDMTPTLSIDAQVDLEHIDWKLYDVLDKFAPFGQGNPVPKYLARNLTIVSLKPMGKDGNHLTVMVKHNSNRIRKTIGWGLCNKTRGDCLDWSKEVKPGDTIDIVFEIGVNEWNGNRELQLTIVDIQKSQP